MVLIKNFVVYIIYNVKTLFKFPVLSGGFLFIISILGLLAPIIAPYDPYVGDIRARLMPPGIISGQYNLQNFDLIKSKDQINQKPRWQQISDIENKSLEKLSISEGSIKIIEFKLGPKTNFVDVNRNGNYIDEIKFDQFSENCLGLSQNYCPKPNISFLNIYKEGANGFIEYRANEEIINNVNDILSLDLMVIREDTKKWSWWPRGLY